MFCDVSTTMELTSPTLVLALLTWRLVRFDAVGTIHAVVGVVVGLTARAHAT